MRIPPPSADRPVRPPVSLLAILATLCLFAFAPAENVSAAALASNCDGASGPAAQAVCEAAEAFAATLSAEQLDPLSYGGDGAPASGSLVFTTPTLSVGEGDGTATVGLQRIGSADGAVSVRVSTSNGTAVAGADYGSLSEVITWADGDASVKPVALSIFGDSQEEPAETFTLSLSEPLGGVTIGTPSEVEVTIDDDDGPIGTCEVNGQTLCLSTENRFQVRASYSAPDGAAGAARTFSLDQRDSGIFYFFNVDNPELLVKVLDGCAINNRFWVLYAATTDVRFDLNVLDTATGATKSYVNPQGQLANSVIDITAFATCPDSGGTTAPGLASASPELLAALELASRPPESPAPKLGAPAFSVAIPPAFPGLLGGCTPDTITLCLNEGGRFQVRATYAAPDGAAGSARAIHLALRDGGIFYFFDPNNAEMLFKVLDGCSINNRFWVLFAGATDVRFTVTVTDTLTGATKVYENPQGHLADAVIDISAFASCS